MDVPYAPDQVPSGPRRSLLDRIATGARVLDVGCWSGFNGRYLIEHRGCRVVGVEPNAKMASLAAASYSGVHVSSIEEALAGSLDDEPFDVVLALDVLEHLIDPDAVLRRLRGCMNGSGHLLVSLPNVAHWSVRKMLLLGRWQYADSGILDRTHLRFYTADTAAALIAGAGFEIVHRDHSLDRPPVVDLPEHRRSILARWPGLFAAQLLFDAHPAAAAS